MGKSTIYDIWSFSIAMLNYQRVIEIFGAKTHLNQLGPTFAPEPTTSRAGARSARAGQITS
jgi:hypothetical protein